MICCGATLKITTFKLIFLNLLESENNKIQIVASFQRQMYIQTVKGLWDKCKRTNLACVYLDNYGQ